MLMLLLAIAIDSAGGVTTAAPVPHAYLSTADPCDSRASADEVVVCGGRDLEADFRLTPPLAASATKPIRAKVNVLGGTAELSAKARLIGADAQDKIVGRHEPSNEWIRLRITVPF